MAMPTANASWRDSARFPKFFGLDSRAVFPMFFFLLHITWWTFIVAALFTAFFSILIRFGFTLSIFRRWTLATLAGPRKVAKPWW